MLHLPFFMLGDGADLSRQRAIRFTSPSPMRPTLLNKFTTVTRAAVKGNVAAVVQGTGRLGLLGPRCPGRTRLGSSQAFLSLWPAVGAI